MAGHRAGAVALAQAVLAEALDDALVALALAGADHVDLIALGENVRLEDVAHVQGGDVVEAELTQGALGGDVSLLEVALGSLVDLLGAHFAVAHLDGLVTV